MCIYRRFFRTKFDASLKLGPVLCMHYTHGASKREQLHKLQLGEIMCAVSYGLMENPFRCIYRSSFSSYWPLLTNIPYNANPSCLAVRDGIFLHSTMLFIGVCEL